MSASPGPPRWLRAGANAGLAAAALALLLLCLSFTDLIPEGDGFGYDGLIYASWVKTLSLERGLAGLRDAQPPFDTYRARRLAPAIAVHAGLRALGLPLRDENVIAGFRAANVALLSLTVFWLCAAADALGSGLRVKAIACAALLLNFPNLKMSLYDPVLTDTAALALGSAGLLLWLRRRRAGLVLVSALGAFSWPSSLHFAVLLIVFPRDESRKRTPSPHALHLWAAGAAAVGCLALIGHLVHSGFSINPTAVRPWKPGIVPASVISAALLFFGLRALLDSGGFWRALHPRRVLRGADLGSALLLVAVVALATRALTSYPTPLTFQSFVFESFYTSVTWPGIAPLAHVLYFGPLLLLLPFVWRPLCADVQRQGAGMVLCFALALAVGVGSESRRLMNFYPCLALFLARALAPLPWTRARIATVAAVAIAFSKVWLPMTRTLALPVLGEFTWQQLFFSSIGPWIEQRAYALQLAMTLPVGALLYAVFVRGSWSGWWDSNPRR